MRRIEKPRKDRSKLRTVIAATSLFLLGAETALAQTTATVTLQGVSSNFAPEPSSGGGADTVADSFTFTAVTGAAKNTPAVSNSVTISGLGEAVAVSISGSGTPKIMINGGNLVSSGTVSNGDTLTVSLVPVAWSANYTAQVTVGDGTPASFAVTSASAPTVGLAAATLPSADVGQAYNGTGYDFQALASLAGGSPADPPVQADLAWSAVSLPPGMALSAAGLLTGSPTTAGEYTLSVTAELEPGISDSQSYTLYIFDNPLVIEGGN